MEDAPLLALRLLERIHGHLGWLAVAALVHPVVVLRRGGRRAPWAVGSAVALPVLAVGLGAALYPAYRRRVRGELFREDLALGWLFERKEHLAFGVVVLAAGAAVAYALARPGGTYEARARSLARTLFAAAALLAAVVAAIGTYLAAVRTF
jgi:hypothetical protein